MRKDITQIKRYTIERVYREHKLFHSHPREMMCVAFDIVTPTTASLVPDAEVLHNSTSVTLITRPLTHKLSALLTLVLWPLT